MKVDEFIEHITSDTTYRFVDENGLPIELQFSEYSMYDVVYVSVIKGALIITVKEEDFELF